MIPTTPYVAQADRSIDSKAPYLYAHLASQNVPEGCTVLHHALLPVKILAPQKNLTEKLERTRLSDFVL